LQGLKINFIDTAGIRKTNDVIENIGVNKSINELNTADLIILILNNNEQLSKDDEQLLSLLENKNYIIYINKNDLATKLDLSSKYSNLVYGNTIKPDGIEPLKDKILELFSLEKINVKDQTYLTNARQKSLAVQALNQINEAIDSLNNNIPVDLIEVNLKECFDTLGEIIGVTYKDELIDEMFSHFCLGK
jgi:tRNA modification GTPase